MGNLRLPIIEKYLKDHQKATIAELCHLLDVSPNSIRRDIAALEEKGIVQSIRGGAQYLVRDSLIDHRIRERYMVTDKTRIAEKAAQLIQDGDTIYLDAGTTTAPIVDFLGEKSNVTIFTTNLDAINNGMKYENLDIIVLPGSLSRKNHSFHGVYQYDFIANYNIRKFFLSTTGISLMAGITKTSAMRAQFCKELIQRCEKTVVLADHSKFNCFGPITCAGFDDIDVVITDANPAQEYVQCFAKHSIELMVV